MIASLRAVLALALLAGLYVLAFLVAVTWLLFAIDAVWTLGSHTASTQFNTTPALLAAGSFLAVLLMLREVGRISQPARPRADSWLIREAQAPQLWALVRDLAERVGTAAPAELRLTGDVNAIVTDDSWLLGLGHGRRRLYLGAPLLVGLRSDELAAVVAHELGHYARRHARFTEPVHRGATALDAARQRIEEAMQANRLIRMYAGPVYLTVTLYGRLFTLLTRPIRQRQELEADRVAARLVGPAALASALSGVPAVAAAWARFQRDFAEPVRRTTGLVPDDPFHAFGCLLADPDIQPLLAKLREQASRQSIAPDSFHPSTADRLARLADAEHPEPANLAPAVELDALLFSRVSVYARDYTVRRQPWQEWIGVLAERHAQAPLAALAGAAEAVRPDRAGTDPPTLQTVLDLLDGRKATELARALDPARAQSEEADGRARDELIAAVCALIGHALVSAGSASWVMGWAGPSRLVAADATSEQIETWVATAVDDPEQVGWLRMQLAAVHLDSQAVVIPDPDRPADVPTAGTRTRTVNVKPALDPDLREQQRTIMYTSLPVMIGLVVLGLLIWAGQDEPAPTYRPPVIQPSYQPPWATPSPPAAWPIPRPSLPTAWPVPLPSRWLVPLPRLTP